ncbi:lysophospholipid acyltransferase family protein [Halodesulfovibrio marinisediminis]|uniref:KDO2-lipid IV(A) lauroyltransferase n=1 Tax=Halodesulfovibrio marinisediminis DSM 17456 TaxID=1121457 RepID=A0A1N6E604_9BACT|nr:lysophospholipid acyltransferase family protein [Halodesulfovibrio marinisediminis]SIN78485.1 KDO2-lipid IV(A) lauroyltransferase [Halodesulfovibrio marinisediminis DSM 17456]
MNPIYSAIYSLGTKMTVHSSKVLGCALGTLMWNSIPKRRKLAIEAVQKHLDVSYEEATVIAKNSFMHNCRSFLEIFLVPKVNQKFIEDLVIQAPENGFSFFVETERPMVATTAHMGAWEVLAGLLGEIGSVSNKAQPLVVVRSNKNENINELIFKLRGGRGAEVLSHRNAVFKVMRSLKKNAIAAFLVDHNTKRKEAIFTDFLGETAAVNSGPAFLALRGKALVVPTFLIRNEKGGYTFIIEEPLDTTKLEGTREEKLQQITRFYTDAIERIVRKHPEQWFWMHNRWKTQPNTDDFILPRNDQK